VKDKGEEDEKVTKFCLKLYDFQNHSLVFCKLFSIVLALDSVYSIGLSFKNYNQVDTKFLLNDFTILQIFVNL